MSFGSIFLNNSQALLIFTLCGRNHVFIPTRELLLNSSKREKFINECPSQTHMTTGIIEGLVSRHGKKERQVAEELAGSLEDKAICLSDGGRQQMQAVGRENLKSGYAVIDTTTSPFARARESAHEILSGAGYNPHSAAHTEREDIGLAVCNWLASGDPSYAHASSEADYVCELLEGFWLGPQKEERQPVLASFAFGLLDGLVQGIERVQPYVKEGMKAAVIEITHSPPIDALDAALFKTVALYTLQPRIVKNFPGNYATGELITFKSVIAGPNPRFEFAGKGRVKLIYLGDLKHLRDQAQRNIEGRF